MEKILTAPQQEKNLLGQPYGGLVREVSISLALGISRSQSRLRSKEEGR